jgi:hypothetical protein
MEKIYVKRSMSSLSKLGGAVAMYLKAGDRVLVKYNNTNERDVLIRFQKKLTVIYGKIDVEYPDSGYVIYDKTIATFKDKPDMHIRGEFELVYDGWGFVKFWTMVSSIWNDFVGDYNKHKNREKW